MVSPDIMIREWTRQRQFNLDHQGKAPRYRMDATQLRRLIWPIIILIVVLALIGLIAWWHWERTRRELENQTHPPSAQVTLYDRGIYQRAG